MAEAEDALEAARQDASRLRGRLSTAETALKVSTASPQLGLGWTSTGRCIQGYRCYIITQNCGYQHMG